MSDKNIVREVAEYCWSNNFLDIFRNYFADHAEEFIGAPPMQSGEHDLKYYSLFQKYLKVYETTLTVHVEKLGYDIGDFYKQVQNIQNANDDPFMQTFIECLLASMDYDSFYNVMVKEASKAQRARAMSATYAMPKKDVEEFKAEGKQGTRAAAVYVDPAEKGTGGGSKGTDGGADEKESAGQSDDFKSESK